MCRKTVANLTIFGLFLTAIASAILAYLSISWLLFGGIIQVNNSEWLSNEFWFGLIRIMLSGPALLVISAFAVILLWAKKITQEWGRGEL